MIILSTFILAHFKYFGIVEATESFFFFMASAELQVIQELHQYNTNKNQTKYRKIFICFTCT